MKGGDILANDIQFNSTGDLLESGVANLTGESDVVNPNIGNVMSLNERGEIPAVINDSIISSTTCWSSSKTNTKISEVDARVDTVVDELSDKADISAIPTKTSDLTNDSGYITGDVINRRYISWGTQLEMNVVRQHYLIMYGNELILVWLAGASLDSFSVRNLGANTTASGTGGVTIGTLTVTKISDGIRVTCTANSTITILC